MFWEELVVQKKSKTVCMIGPQGIPYTSNSAAKDTYAIFY